MPATATSGRRSRSTTFSTKADVLGVHARSEREPHLLRHGPVNLSTVTIEETEVTERLAAWAGIWSMNFRNMPELKLAWGYPAALGIITAACIFMGWRFRRTGWL